MKTNFKADLIIGQDASNLGAQSHVAVSFENPEYSADVDGMDTQRILEAQPDDFVIATGVQYTVRQFIEWTAEALGMQLRWEGKGVNEVGYWLNRHCEERSDAAIHGPVPVVRIDPRYFRPTEVETLLGDPSKAKEKLGWVPEISVQAMCKEMVAYDLAEANKNSLLRRRGYAVNVSFES